MIYSSLFGVWTISITWSAVFLIAVSLYLYWDRRKRFVEGTRVLSRSRLSDFVFVWVLLCLLAFYIVSVNLGSATFFAAGNIVAEAILLFYVLKRGIKQSSAQNMP
jgi:uncharacterized membrane protein